MTKNHGTTTYPRHRLETLEPYYSRHVGAMTEEGLHHKSDIAEQLAWRDGRIAELSERLMTCEALRAQNIDDLEAELERSAKALANMAEDELRDDYLRVLGKADGVRLALGKLQQFRRETATGIACDLCNERTARRVTKKLKLCAKCELAARTE